MLGGSSTVGLATGVAETVNELPPVPAPIVIPEESVQDQDIPIAANILFAEGSDPTLVTAQIPIPDKADVAHISNVSASTRGLEGNLATLNVESVPTETLNSPRDVLLIRSMDISI